MAAHSMDFRIRLFNYSLAHSIRQTAAVFRVSPTTVHRLQKLFYETGQLSPKPSHAGRPRVVSEEGELFLQAVLVEEADLTLNELRDRYATAYGVHVSLGAMHDTLQRLGLSRKKKTTYDPLKDSEAHQADTQRYHQQVDPIPLDERLYLDETGARLNLTLAYGRARRGQRVVAPKPVTPGDPLNTVAVLTEQGLAAPWFFKGTLTARRFVTYLRVFLRPLLRGGKTLILDKHPVHRARRVQAFLKRHHVQYVFLPTYSPELNPIEEAWSKFKYVLRRAQARTQETLLEAMKQASKAITPEDAQGYFQHAEDFSLVTT
jgi:transposase